MDCGERLMRIPAPFRLHEVTVSPEWTDYKAMLDSDDAREGARAFAERRPPRWTGR